MSVLLANRKSYKYKQDSCKLKILEQIIGQSIIIWTSVAYKATLVLRLRMARDAISERNVFSIMDCLIAWLSPEIITSYATRRLRMEQSPFS